MEFNGCKYNNKNAIEGYLRLLLFGHAVLGGR
jgi:hypothetical protein